MSRVSASIAQLVEQLPLKQLVVGSNPTGRTCRVTEFGQVAELVYALVLGTSSSRIEGSSPSLPT